MLVQLIFIALLFATQAKEIAVVSGMVAEPNGADISNAEVIVRSASGTQTVVRSHTGENGVFHLHGVEPGTYDLDFSAAGFKSRTLSGIVLKAGETKLPQIRLQVGDVGGHPVEPSPQD